MGTSNLIVVVHGSALAHERPNDIDVVFAGDRAEAERVVRAWAVERFGERGASLPLDMHPTTGLTGVYELGPRKGELCDLVQLPRVPGRDAPYATLRGRPEVKLYERRCISSWLRSPLPATEMHAKILAAGGWRVRLAIESDPADASREDWRDYCDGPRALRSAIAKMGAQRWAELRALDPELYGLIEDVVEYGTRHVPPATLDAIRRGTPGGGPFASLDVLLPGTSMNPSSDRVVTTTHGRMGWTLGGFRRLLAGFRRTIERRRVRTPELLRLGRRGRRAIVQPHSQRGQIVACNLRGEVLAHQRHELVALALVVLARRDEVVVLRREVVAREAHVVGRPGASAPEAAGDVLELVAPCVAVGGEAGDHLVTVCVFDTGHVRHDVRAVRVVIHAHCLRVRHARGCVTSWAWCS